MLVKSHEHFDSSTSRIDLLCDRLEALAPSPRHSARVWMMRCYQHKYAFDSEGALTAGSRAWHAAQQLGDAPLVAESRLALGTVLSLHDRFDEALVHFEAGLAWLDQHGSDEALIDNHGNVALLYDNLGRLSDGRLHHERVLALLDQQPGNLNLTVALSNFAINRIDAGDYRCAREHLLRALRGVASSASPRADEAFARLMLALCDLQVGHLTQALNHLDAAEPVMRELNAERLPVVIVRRAHAWLALGQHARVGQALQALHRQSDVVLSAAFWAQLLDERLRRALEQPAGDGLERAEALLPATGRLDLRYPLRIEQAMRLPGPQAVPLLESIVEETTAHGFRGHALTALLRAAELAAGFDAAGALGCARRAFTLAEDAEPAMIDHSERWLQPSRAALAAGDMRLACQWASEGADWLNDTARRQVAPEFRDSFLHRNPANREMLALAARLQV